MSDDIPPQHELSADNADYVERLLEQFADQPNSVPSDWRRWFEQITVHRSNGHSRLLPQARPSQPPRSLFNPAGDAGDGKIGREHAQLLQHRVDALVDAFRTQGHLLANLDPLGMAVGNAPDLSPAAFGIEDRDLSKTVFVDTQGELTQLAVRDLLPRLKKIYCSHIGYQFMHVEDAATRRWLLQHIEQPDHEDLSAQQRRRILHLLTKAAVFEEFMRTKYLGAKTFSLEGAVTLIPLLDMAIEQAADHGVREVVFGMPHRGRLSVLANIIGQPMREIFAQFEDLFPEQRLGGGDVKYHLGASGDYVTTKGDQVHLSLCFNPSHLEYVNPVALGRVRAKQDRTGDFARRRGMALLIHGDAAFAGEGVVQETLNLSQLPDYTTGGALHVIVNNQIGFTTRPDQGRSTTYATDVARMLQVPIFHVNGEHPDAVARVVQLAIDFRQEFQRDVVIDMYCFRRHGHNESDEPGFTQPQMVQAIEHHPPLRQTYYEDLAASNQISEEDTQAIADDHREHLKTEFDAGKNLKQPPRFTPTGVWEGYCGGPEPVADDSTAASVKTAIGAESLKSLLRKLTDTPEDFHLHRKLQRSVDDRREMAAGERPLDWAAAEALAIASLAIEGHPVRLTGQDSERGTFSQRHSVLHDVVNGKRHSIFANLSKDQAAVDIVNSPLSESGVMGFDYGYSLDCPNALVAWEAQFGDFANAAQVIIDQFITSAEDKWYRLSGLVLLLPHGFEGQGPEHSSARLERLLALTAEDNIQVTNPTTPAQYFHLLRRQVKRNWRKPLVVLTPKSLLRHPLAVSPLSDLAEGNFQRVLADERNQVDSTRRVLLCSGKIYYDLKKYRDENEHHDVAILRIEQYYPLGDDVLRQALAPYDSSTPVVWVQEEPINMGAWPRWRRRFGEQLWREYALDVIAREASASPATGSKAAHEIEQQRLMENAFAEEIPA